MHESERMSDSKGPGVEMPPDTSVQEQRHFIPSWAHRAKIIGRRTEICVICKEGATSKKRLVNNPVMTDEILQHCQERVSLGLKQENSSTFGSSECRKPIVNKNKIERLRKRSRTDSPVALHEDRGDLKCCGICRPAKAVKDYSKGTSVSIFHCDFCPKMGSEHCTVFLLTQWVKHSYRSQQKTPDDHLEFQ
ncbi:hypothetical protein GWK47_026547 [Chionoecetes opilio]|uniref:Uncharacterized protein n=1 Tax=Chionoecetes opilio TaxID=41210 RepID=A0A8J8WCY6_CHIOP|nr:hypothetical protein GWK47_026547 [Chionoecetes opilio]